MTGRTFADMLADLLGNGDEMTELYDADIPRVDLVDRPANGVPFLISKSQTLMSPDQVRALIAKAGPNRGSADEFGRDYFRRTDARTKGTPTMPTTRRPVAKAKNDPMVAVFTADGRLVGAVLASKIQQLSPAPGFEDAKPADPAQDGVRDSDVSLSSAKGDTLQAQPKAQAGVPADAGDVVQKAARNGLRITSAAELAIVRTALAAVQKAAARGDSVAAVEIIRQREAHHAAQALQRQRATRARR